MMLFTAALAAPVADGVQAQIHPEGLSFLSVELDQRSFGIGPFDIDSEVSCYELDVDDFNLAIDVMDVELEATGEGLAVDVTLTAQSNYVRIAGDSGWIDTCIDFDVLVEEIRLDNARLQGVLVSEVVNGRPSLRFQGTPSLTGDITSDTDWVPDSLVWSVVEGLVLDYATSTLEEQLPSLVEQYTSEPLALDVFDVALTVGLSDLRISQNGLYTTVAVDLGTEGSVGRPLDLSPLDDSHLAVGITEPMATAALTYGWQSGLLDLGSDANRALLNDLLVGLGLGIDVDARLDLMFAPVVAFGPDGMGVDLSGVVLDIRNGAGEPLLFLDADLGATLDVATESGDLTLSAHDVTIDLRTLQADALLADGADPVDIQNFVEGWVARFASSFVSGIPVYSSNFEALGYLLQVRDVRSEDGGVVAYGRLYRSNDPAVDRTAPDTSLDLAVLDEGFATATFSAADDRPGGLTFAWRMDGGSWSTWSDEPTAEIAATPGFHTVEAISRDSWGNVDDTPALASFDVAEVDEAPRRGCETARATGVFSWMKRRR